MGEKDQGNNNIIKTLKGKSNPYAQTIISLSRLITVLQEQLKILKIKHSEKRNQTFIDNVNQKTTSQLIVNQEENKVQNIPNQSVIEKKQFIELTQKINLRSKELQKALLRLQLLNLGNKVGYLSQNRVDQLQKIFKHYCNYIFKFGKHVTFERIEFEKEHLIMERFFAFVNDFGLNKWHHFNESKQLMPKHELILLFKKSASNSRNLQFSEFISSLERLAMLRYDYQQTYQQRKQKQQKERRKIRQINLRRQKQRERKRLEKLQLQKQKQLQQLRTQQQQQKLPNQQESTIMERNNNEQQQPKLQSKQERKLRRKKQKQSEKDKKKKSKLPINSKENQPLLNQNQESENQNHQNHTLTRQTNNASLDVNNQNENNDYIVSEMMQKDKLLSNPTSPNYSQLKQTANILQNQNNHQDTQRNTLLSLTKQEKVELLFKFIELDNPKAVEAKLRKYEKPLYKQNALQRKSSFLSDSSSISKLKHLNQQNALRLNQLKSKLIQRKKQNFKLNLSRSITDQKYHQKTKDDYQKYLNKSLTASNHDLSEIKKSSLKKYNENPPLSLNALNQSSQTDLTNLKLPFNLKSSLHAEEDDSVFLKQYGELTKIRSSNSSYISKSPRYSIGLKKRVKQIEEEEKRKEEQKLERFAIQMYKNQHYMKRFLQRRL